MQQHNPYRVIISGGGTGGHIYPAVAIANAIKARFPDAEILFVGAKGRMEMQKVPAAGYKIEGLWISGIQRKLSLDNLAFPLKVVASYFKARKIVKTFKPDIAIGVGGYASWPLLQAANSIGVSTLIQEQNSYAGVANKALSKKVQAICVAYERMERFFPAQKIVYTGNPVRKDIVDYKKFASGAHEFFGLKSGIPTLFVMGGSLGARTINLSIERNLETLKAAGIQVLWQTGKFYYESLKQYNSETIKVTDFIADMNRAYAMADVIVSRAGALSISELSIVGKPCILVPSPNVAEDHQTKNARALSDKQAAWMIRDVDAPTDLVAKALTLMNDSDTKTVLSKNILTFAKPDATERIADKVIEIINATKK
jgi:UDP-N-acetylglucosamine--N-acetylmuramyl-(pentapeptide) pyrophosphoryl-undecaprenol N-acetylglucosamine transferase